MLPYPPEVDDDRVVGVVVAAVRSVALPVVDVDVLQPGEQQLQLVGVEDGEEVLRHELIEAFHEGRHLTLHATHEPPADHQPETAKKTTSVCIQGERTLLFCALVFLSARPARVELFRVQLDGSPVFKQRIHKGTLTPCILSCSHL